MPSGQTHAKATIVLAPLAAATGYIVSGSPDTALQLGFGTLLGVFLTPDLDYAELRIRSISVLGNVGKAWQAYWWAYGKLLAHRSFWSHFPIVSTLIRLLYLLAIPLIYYTIRNKFDNFQLIMGYLWDYRWTLAGLMLADMLHYVMDITFTSAKMMTRRMLDNKYKRV